MAEKNGNGKIVGENDMRTCACGPNCTCGCGHRVMHRVLWWALGVIILCIVFCMGVAAGHFGDRLRSLYGGYYGNSFGGYPMMMRGGYYYGGSYGNGGGTAIPPTATPANGSATATAPNAQ